MRHIIYYINKCCICPLVLFLHTQKKSSIVAEICVANRQKTLLKVEQTDTTLNQR